MFLWLLSSLALAAPGYCPAPVGGAELLSAAAAAWEAGPGADAQALERARRQARLQALGSGTGLSVSGLSEQLPGKPELTEQTATVALTASLGRYGVAQRQAIDAQAALSQEELRLARWAYLEATLEAWLTWRTASLEEAHLLEYLHESDEALEPLRAGQRAGLVTRLELADLETELSRIQGELGGAQANASAAQAEIVGLLGGCAVRPDAALDAPDWAALIESAARHPSVALLRAEAGSAEAQGQRARSATPATLQAGLSARQVGDVELYRGPMLTLSVPLNGGGRASATQLEAQGASLRRRADWQTERVAAELEALQAAHRALEAQREALITYELGPLSERVDLMTEALEASQSDVSTLIRARRDLHEAEHRLLVIELALEASALRAGALLALLEEDPDATP